MIQAQHLVKWFGATCAVNDISFQFQGGQVVGFLGPNGAGKSTTLRMITGYIPPTSGRASIAGFDVVNQSQEARRRIGYLPETTPLYPEMRVEEFLHFRGKLMDMPRSRRKQRIDVVADRCGLSRIRRRIIGELSKGNRQRVGVAQALLHEPEVLILDEPTAGLDPVQIGEFRKLIRELGQDHLVMLSSHILPEVERTADQVMIIAGGRIVSQGSPEQLRQQVASGADIVACVQASGPAAQKAIQGIDAVEKVRIEHEHQGWCELVITPHDGQSPMDQIGQTALKNGWALRELRRDQASLEAFFVQITADQEQAASTAGSAA